MLLWVTLVLLWVIFSSLWSFFWITLGSLWITSGRILYPVGSKSQNLHFLNERTIFVNPPPPDQGRSRAIPSPRPPILDIILFYSHTTSIACRGASRHPPTCRRVTGVLLILLRIPLIVIVIVIVIVIAYRYRYRLSLSLSLS